ncbi:MAG TPA: PIN domain-containing protein [Gemmatimonadaceae bacterium]|nr:PIN domain-containing protein [Gemmatimonadaceae bacterium]
MSRAVFLDTSGWFAAVNRREYHHAQVVAAYADLVQRRVLLITTNLVVAEMHTLIVRHRGAEAGCALLDAIYADPAYRVIESTRVLESAATDRWLRPFQNQRFSLTDAVSFETMRSEGVDEALGLDHHFEVAGYRLLPHSTSPATKRGRAKRGG